jgi:hypothetical protein
VGLYALALACVVGLACASGPPTSRVRKLVNAGKSEHAVKVAESYLVEGELEGPDEMQTAFLTVRNARGRGRVPVAVRMASLASTDLLELGPTSPLHWLCQNDGKVRVVVDGKTVRRRLPTAVSVSLMKLDGEVGDGSAYAGADDITITESSAPVVPMYRDAVIGDTQHEVTVAPERWYDLAAHNGQAISAIDLESIKCHADADQSVTCSTAGLETLEIGASERAEYAGVRSMVCSNATPAFGAALHDARIAAHEGLAEPAHQFAMAQFRETGDLSLLDAFLEQHPDSPQAATVGELVAERRLAVAQDEDGKVNLSRIEEVALQYAGTRAGKRARTMLEEALLAKVLEPTKIVLMIEFLKGPIERDDTSIDWTYLDESEVVEQHRKRVRASAVALLSEKQCSNLMRYCNRWVNAFPDDPETPKLRKLLADARKRKLKGWQWKKFAACTDGCFKRCKGGEDEACYEECQTKCDAKYGRKKQG